MKLLISLLIVLAACGTDKKAKHSPVNASLQEQLQTKLDKLRPLNLAKRDPNGFIDTTHCDSLLFTGLLNAVDNTPANMLVARDDTGKWHRRPLYLVECYPEHSKSTISRDMFVGLMWYIWRTKQLTLAEELYDYGSSNLWVMGEGDISRTLFSPNLQATLAEIIFKLGGENKNIVRAIPQSFNGDLTGFEAHLQVLTALLRAELLGTMEPRAFDAVAKIYSSQPNNPLFAYAHRKYTTGDMTPIYETLLREDLWPSDRLPTSRDRKTYWLQQRDDGADWQPDLENPITEFDASDFIFITKLLQSSSTP